MKKVININFQGQVIAIEEAAYEILKQYIDSLKRYFSREEDGEEIVNDIESRIAELFGNRLKHGISCITDEDVEAIITSIGKPEDFDSNYEETSAAAEEKFASGANKEKSQQAEEEHRQLFRNENDKLVAGVCSGLANYFKIDPIWVRLAFLLLFSAFSWLVYIVFWIVLKPKALESNANKRLYRNPNDRFIAGVCGGIATYFKIDAWIPRIIFLVPLLLYTVATISFLPFNNIFRGMDFGWMPYVPILLMYLLLWILVPQAKTVKQKLEMLGEEGYIKSIRETVSDNVAYVKSHTENEQSYAEYKASHSHSQPERSGCLNVLITFFKVVFFLAVGFFALVLIAVSVALLFAGAQLLPLKSLFIDAGTETTLLILFGILTIIIPIVAIIIWIIRRMMKAKSRPVIGVIATLLWLSGIVIGGVLAYNIATKYRVEATNERSIPISPIAGNKMYLEMLPYANDYTAIRVGFGRNSAIRGLYFSTDEDTFLFRNVYLQIRETSDSLFSVRTIAASHGRSLRAAQADASAIIFNIVQRDSLLLLPEFLSIPVSQGFRDQSITVEVSVPAGKQLEICNELNRLERRRPPRVVQRRLRR